VRGQDHSGVGSRYQTKNRPKFIFVFGAENGLFDHFCYFFVFGGSGISFSSAFLLTAENETNASSVSLYIKLFQIGLNTYTSMIFKRSTKPVPDSLHVAALKN